MVHIDDTSFVTDDVMQLLWTPIQTPRTPDLTKALIGQHKCSPTPAWSVGRQTLRLMLHACAL